MESSEEEIRNKSVYKAGKKAMASNYWGKEVVVVAIPPSRSAEVKGGIGRKGRQKRKKKFGPGEDTYEKTRDSEGKKLPVM